MLLHPDPYPTRQDWCAALVEKEEKKLAAARAEHPDLPLIIINHWPLRQDLVKLTLVPRFRIWCGTTKVRILCEISLLMLDSMSNHFHQNLHNYCDWFA
jgi:hypothetical protein